MKWEQLMGKNQGQGNSLKDSDYLTNLLVALSEKKDTPELIAYLADERKRLLIVKSLVSPISGSDRELARLARKILRSRGMDPEDLKKRVEPAAFALGLMSTCDLQIDYYDVLGVQPSATPSELRAAYRKRAFELHPDTREQSSQNEADFVTVKAAYDSLMDPDSRRAFDQCQRQLDAWHEEDVNGVAPEKVARPSRGNTRKVFYRVAAVVLVLVAFAWVLSVLYEAETMLEVAQIAPPAEPDASRKMAGVAVDTGEVETKALVASNEVQEKAARKPATKKPAAQKRVLEKAEPEKATTEKPETEKGVLKKPKREKPEPPPLRTAAVILPDAAKKEETLTPELEQLTSPPPVEKEEPKAASVPEPVETKKASSVEVEKKDAPVVQDSIKETRVEHPKPEKKEAVKQKPAVVKKKEAGTRISLPSKLPEKPAEPPVQPVSGKSQRSGGATPGVTSSPTEKVQTTRLETHIPETVMEQTPVFSVDTTEDPPPPKSSLHASKVPSPPAFPRIPLPETHKTPFVKRSEILAFLEEYTAAYEKGNAETFFSLFTPNATENGKSLKSLQPDYLEIWEKVKSLSYRISLDETEQVVGSDTVVMKGRFNLNWVFLDGPSGRSRGEIKMNLKLNKDDLVISRLDYRFDD